MRRSSLLTAGWCECRLPTQCSHKHPDCFKLHTETLQLLCIVRCLEPWHWLPKHRVQGSIDSSCALSAGVDTLLIAVLNSPEIASALEEAGISAKQMAASVEELRGSSAKVLLCRRMPLVAHPVFIRSECCCGFDGHSVCWLVQSYILVYRPPVRVHRMCCWLAVLSAFVLRCRCCRYAGGLADGGRAVPGAGQVRGGPHRQGLRAGPGESSLPYMSVSLCLRLTDSLLDGAASLASVS